METEISAKYNIGRYGNNGVYIHNDSGMVLNIFNSENTDELNWQLAKEWAEVNYQRANAPLLRLRKLAIKG